MSDTWNTNKRRTFNRTDDGEYDDQFSGERYGNRRKFEAHMKVAKRRTERSVAKRQHQKEIMEIDRA